MKSFVLERMSLLSPIERAGRTLAFHPKTTVIKGKNDSGKSSLIKSIFQTLGADPPDLHPLWKSADVRSLLEFTLDKERFSVLRNRRSFAVFDGNGRIIHNAVGVTQGIGPYLAELFDFKLRLADRQGKVVTPPPAYQLVPYYIDQDRGWTDLWSSFGALQQIPGWRKDVAEFHVGMRPNEYYAAKHKVALAQVEREEPVAEERSLRRLHAQVEREVARVSFDIDVDQYKAEISRLMEVCRGLSVTEEEYRQKLVELEKKRAVIVGQIDIVRRVEGELSADLDFAVDHLEDEVNCPICGAGYHNSFAERFSLARDEDSCIQLRAELQDQLQGIEAQIDSHKAQMLTTAAQRGEIEQLLESKQGEVSLQSLIEARSRREMRSEVEKGLLAARTSIALVDQRIERLQEQMARYDNREHRHAILEAFYGLMRRFLDRLAVWNLPDEAYRRIDPRIKETGSDLPRAILAYSVAMLRLIEAHGSSTFFPFVVDSPNQQDQDEENLVRMLRFLKEALPDQTQLVVGFVKAEGVEFGGATVVLDGNRALLREQYDEVEAIMRPYLRQV